MFVEFRYGNNKIPLHQICIKFLDQLVSEFTEEDRNSYLEGEKEEIENFNIDNQEKNEVN